MFVPSPTKTPNIASLVIDNWNKGRISVLDENRGLLSGLDSSVNVQVVQNGAVAPRNALELYGTQTDGLKTGLDEITRIENGEPVNYLVMTERPLKAGGGYEDHCVLKYSRDGGTWTTAPGMTYNSTSKHYFCQANNLVLVTNGVDKTNYLDLADMTIKKFIKLDKPSNLGITATGLAEGGVVLRYAITAQNRGETDPAFFTTQKVNLERREWTSGTHSIKLTWDKVPNAERYLIYVGTEEGKEQYLTAVSDDGSATYSFTDTGVIYPQPKTTPPETNTTEGVVATRAININGVVYLVGDKANPYRVYFDGGTPKTALNFSWFGGGFIDVAPGSKDLPVTVIGYRTGKGDPVPTVLCRRSSGRGTMKHLVDQTIDVAGTPVSIMTVQEANGQEGTDAPDAVLVYRSDVYYLSRDGFKKTGTQPQLQGVLGTATISATIQPDVLKLNTKALEKAVATAREGQLLFSLPVASSDNNQIWMYDIDRGGIWLLPWAIHAQELLQYGDNLGMTHDLALVNNKIMKFSDSIRTVDNGIPFETEVKTSQVYFGKNKEFARVIDVTVELIAPEGEINLELTGWTRDGEVETTTITKVFTPKADYVGWGDKYKFPSLKWLGFHVLKPIREHKERKIKTITFEPNQDYKWVAVRLWTDKGVSYQLNNILARYVTIGHIKEEEADNA